MDAKRGLHPALALMAATMLVAALASLLLKGAFKEGLRPRFSLLMVGPAVAGEQGPEAGLLLEAHRCAFGRWYFSPERREMAAGYPEIQPLLAELGALHLEMHCSARMIRAFLSRGDRPAALAYHQE